MGNRGLQQKDQEKLLITVLYSIGMEEYMTLYLSKPIELRIIKVNFTVYKLEINISERNFAIK